MSTLETERLLLSPSTVEDAEALYQEIYSDPDVVPLYNKNQLWTIDQVDDWIVRRQKSRQFINWTVTRKETREVIGEIHLDPYANVGWREIPEESELLCKPPEIHMGFAFGKRFWGKGYAFEACQAVITYAFRDLRLLRLLGGADVSNARSIRLHERLGFRLIHNPENVVAVLTNPLIAYRIRPFEENDRDAVKALGSFVINWWHTEVAGASLHLVAEVIATGEIVGHLQARDRSVPEPSRRLGQCHFNLLMASEHRRQGIGAALMERLAVFALRRNASLLYTAYKETADAPAASFLKRHNFVPLERFLPSVLDLTTFEPDRFSSAIDRVKQQGITLATYAKIGDSTENRQRLYALEEAAHAVQPFREVGPYISVPYEKWKAEFLERDQTTIFLALAPQTGEFVGVVTALEWYFTGTHPDWSGRGIAMALKVRCLQEAKARGITEMETENHEDNTAMLAINRKLGFIFTDPEVACIKLLA